MEPIGAVEVVGPSAARLTCRGSRHGAELTLVLSGAAELPDRPELGRVLGALHALALEQHTRQVNVDLKGLAFMTSSCFKDFVTWLKRIEDLGHEQRYRVHFHSNPQHRWQKTSLSALSAFAVDVVSFDLIPTASVLDLAFAADIAVVGKVRAFVQEFYGSVIADADAIAGLAMGAHELLENALVHSADGRTRIRIECAAETGGHRLSIRTWNRPRPGDLQALFDGLQESRQLPPAEFYRRLIIRTSTRAEGSGLGLGRVLAEAGMSIRAEMVGEDVCVIAESRVASAPPPS